MSNKKHVVQAYMSNKKHVVQAYIGSTCNSHSNVADVC